MTMREQVAMALVEAGVYCINSHNCESEPTSGELAAAAITACLTALAVEADKLSDGDDSCIYHPMHGWMTVPAFIRSFLPSQPEGE